MTQIIDFLDALIKWEFEVNVLFQIKMKTKAFTITKYKLNLYINS